MKIRFTHSYESVISLENLLEAWKEFIIGKRSRKDVQEFELNLMGNIIDLHEDLTAKTYSHSAYEPFNISDPKPRRIHKSLVRDRLLHHAIYRQLYPFFDKTFIADSYSCQINKGTHKALNQFREFGHIASKNHTKTVWVLKCDIRKFFASIDHAVLLEILRTHIDDDDIIWLLERIVGSFNSGKPRTGLPLGNLTSQLLVNIYMNEFDQFMKHRMKIRYYIRYADDFVVLSQDKAWLEELLPKIADFLSERLKLDPHPDKISIRTLSSGIDFLGWVHFPDHRVLRTVTKRRMMKRIKENPRPEVMNSYLGLLKHGNTQKLRKRLI
ncbi:MAG: group II intron reverse transcriptase domain-containing protein [Candidatus Yanofskybacteria bacterium]|nr:group II intron reverse transcriptase domain-containing protein [Candidatus Yanofskybacteria bacterium]